MIVQTEITPNPNSLKFVPGKKVSLIGPIEITESDKTSNDLVRNILTLKGVKSIFLSDDFISVNKEDDFVWEDLKHIIISFINEYFSKGHNCVINNSEEKNDLDTSTVEGQIIKLLETLPSNESLAMEAMKNFPTVIGHSGLDVQGDAGRNDIKDSSVKVF